jgi:hypothetical protein
LQVDYFKLKVDLKTLGQSKNKQIHTYICNYIYKINTIGIMRRQNNKKKITLNESKEGIKKEEGTIIYRVFGKQIVRW